MQGLGFRVSGGRLSLRFKQPRSAFSRWMLTSYLRWKALLEAHQTVQEGTPKTDLHTQGSRSGMLSQTP